MPKRKKKLKSGFIGGEITAPDPEERQRSDVPIARREPLAYWEDLPRMGPEIILAEPERQRRQFLFRQSHLSTFAERCGDVWPPMPLESSERPECSGLPWHFRDICCPRQSPLG